MDFSEFQLKEIFKNGRFVSPLQSVTGKKVEIIETGIVNSDTGPDFKRALVRIDGKTMRGDIEFHRQSSDWYSHGHHGDRNYNPVVLHVVGTYQDNPGCMTQSGRRVEVVKLTDFLSPDAADFLKWLATDERLAPIKCAKDNGGISPGEKLEYLQSLGHKRFAHKVKKFEERLKDIIDENRPVVFEAKQTYFKDFADVHIEHRTYSESELQEEEYWDQLLYEGILEGLGYSKNAAAFKKLARSMPLSFLKEHSDGERTSIVAMMFGASGLLPQSTDGYDDESKTYCEELNMVWRHLKKKYKREYVDKSEWLFFKLRPQNFPTVRIAGAGHLLSGESRNMSARSLVGSDPG
ncbi:MAG: DUF2851 family protein, partial [Bacteroidetes bacterium]|nr:DUF2851 family protein [Bacteroidota bacterium]